MSKSTLINKLSAHAMNKILHYPEFENRDPEINVNFAHYIAEQMYANVPNLKYVIATSNIDTFIATYVDTCVAYAESANEGWVHKRALKTAIYGMPYRAKRGYAPVKRFIKHEDFAPAATEAQIDYLCDVLYRHDFQFTDNELALFDFGALSAHEARCILNRFEHAHYGLAASA